jgi:hypothetical protein
VRGLNGGGFASGTCEVGVMVCVCVCMLFPAVDPKYRVLGEYKSADLEPKMSKIADTVTPLSLSLLFFLS